MNKTHEIIDVPISSHSHCAQWGFVLEGEMWLTIDDETKLYRKGDWYYIPEGITHSATFPTRLHAIDFFDDPGRYQAKLSWCYFPMKRCEPCRLISRKENRYIKTTGRIYGTDVS